MTTCWPFLILHNSKIHIYLSSFPPLFLIFRSHHCIHSKKRWPYSLFVAHDDLFHSILYLYLDNTSIIASSTFSCKSDPQLLFVGKSNSSFLRWVFHHQDQGPQWSLRTTWRAQSLEGTWSRGWLVSRHGPTTDKIEGEIRMVAFIETTGLVEECRVRWKFANRPFQKHRI